ncbi:hypothetical protein AMK16_01400 [Streptomyces sp. CB00455]|uniref:hypothetical protein n=1 Tax=Streptomyces sp. CB00455 TaxID=1703927 RepID=UPI000939D737|nr:hypothetical protein [Streptomyces sp. CB00455]OKK21932.1 hypothetical protein AMK16_01400 [Streptomyces sp. CB00455]
MHVVVGIVVAVFGIAPAVAGPRFSAAVGSGAGQRFKVSDTAAFRLLGPVIAVLGVLYAVGVVG